MIAALVQFGALKLALSCALAAIAWGLQRRANRPQVSHMAWLLVLATMIMPPVLDVPDVVSGLLTPPVLVGATQPWTVSKMSGVDLPFLLAVVWIAGGVVVLAWSLSRILRFNRLVVRATTDAGRELQDLASTVAASLGLATTPEVRMINATVSPLVWWVGRVTVVIPVQLVAVLDADQLRLILTHEFAHIRRRDHLVRCVECAACVVFWWNPVTWLARRNIRVAEELCCDAIVLASADANPRRYARSLLAVLDFLSLAPSTQPPAMAMRAVAGRHARTLTLRLQMILSPVANHWQSRRRWLAARIAAVSLLPIGLFSVTSTDRDVRSILSAKEACDAIVARLGPMDRTEIAKAQKRAAKAVCDANKVGRHDGMGGR